MPRFVYVTERSPSRVWQGLRARLCSEVSVVEADAVMQTQTFRCNSCGDTIHVDTDWVDSKGGFIGSVFTVNPYRATAGPLGQGPEGAD